MYWSQLLFLLNFTELFRWLAQLELYFPLRVVYQRVLDNIWSLRELELELAFNGQRTGVGAFVADSLGPFTVELRRLSTITSTLHH